MIREDSTPRFLGYALLATRFVTVVDAFQRNRGLTGKDSATLDEAKNFLKCAAEGQKVSEAGEVGERALEAANAYGEAIDATISLVNGGAAIRPDVSALLWEFVSNIEKLQHGESPAAENLDLAKRFFLALRETTLSQTTDGMETSEIWTTPQIRTD